MSRATAVSCGRGLSSIVGFVFKFCSEVTVASEAVLVKQIKSVVWFCKNIYININVHIYADVTVRIINYPDVITATGTQLRNVARLPALMSLLYFMV